MLVNEFWIASGSLIGAVLNGCFVGLPLSEMLGSFQQFSDPRLIINQEQSGDRRYYSHHTLYVAAALMWPQIRQPEHCRASLWHVTDAKISGIYCPLALTP